MSESLQSAHEAVTSPRATRRRAPVGVLFSRTCRRLFTLALLIAWLMPGTAASKPYEEDTLDFYLMDVAADGYVLTEGISTYRSDNAYFIHFPSFLEAVEFPINRDGRIWAGWFRSEQSQFTWDMDTADVQVGAVRSSSAAMSFELDEGTFVSFEAIEAWFGIELNLTLRTQMIAVTSSDPLPFQRRAAQESAKNRHRPRAADEVDVHVPDQYRWATTPVLDLSSHYRVQGSGSDAHAEAQGALTMGLDLAKHSVLYSGSTGSDAGHRLTIARRASVADGTLVLGVDSYTLGDVIDDRSNLVNGGGRGAGFSINRRRSGSSGSQSRVAISGDGPPGWEAELYRNNALIAFGSVTSDGLYFFPDRETVYGENLFVVRLFGPQGQIREQHQSFWGGGIDLEQGDYSFSVNHVDFTERFIGGELANTSSLASEKTSGFHYARALTSDLQVGAGYTQARVGSRTPDGPFSDSEYATVDGRMNVGSGLLLAELVQQQERGSAWSLQYLTGRGGHHMTVSYQAFRDFESPYTVRRIQADAHSQFMLAGPLDLAGLNSYTFRFTRQDRADGLSDFRIFNRLGARWGAVNLSNDMDYLRVSSGDEFLLGSLRVTGRLNRLSLRAQLDYDPASAEPLNQISAMLRWNATRNTYYAAAAHQSLKSDQLFHLENTLTTRVGKLNLSISLNTSSGDFWSLGVTLGRSFGYDDGAGSFAGHGGSLAHTGRAALNLFLDLNNNGIRDPGEPPLGWASYKEHSASETAAGVIKIAGIPPYVPLRLESRDFRFDDPFLVPRDRAYEFYTHPGSRVSANIPVVMTGDVDGYLHSVPGRDSTVSGLTVVLHDAQGKLVATTRSEFDGYYSFRGIATGEYEVVVDTSSGQADVQRQQFSLNSEDGFVPLSPMFIYWN